jgi:hypothetical protein
MHTSGFVALSILILVIAVAVLVFTTSGSRRDLGHGAPPPSISLGR